MVIEKGRRKSVAKPGQLRLAAVRSLPAVATILLPRFLLPVSDDPAGAALTAVIYGCAALLALLLFRPGPTIAVRQTLLWSLNVTLLFAVVLAVDPLTRQVLFDSPGIVLTVLLLAATVGVVAHRMPQPVAIAVLALFTFGPLWAAPAVELAGNPGWLTDAVVAASPVTLVAVAVDLDYLRTSWFYANSALGSMRYAYPDRVGTCVLLSLVPLAALLTGVLRAIDFTSYRIAKEAQP